MSLPTTDNKNNMNIELLERNLPVHEAETHEQFKAKAWEGRMETPLFLELDNYFKGRNEYSVVWNVRVDQGKCQAAKDAEAVFLCADERLSDLKFRQLFEIVAPVYTVRIPASRLGFTDEELKKITDELVGEGALKIHITSHKDCGAAKLDAAPGEDPDKHAQKMVANVEQLGMDNLGFIDEKEASALEDPHPGFCLVVDMTGRWTPLVSSELPEKHFVLSGKYYESLNRQDLLKKHAGILVNIPMGEHGIGKEEGYQKFGFSQEHPLYIFVTDSEEERLNQKILDLQEIASKSEGLVKIIGFILPLEEN